MKPLVAIILLSFLVSSCAWNKEELPVPDNAIVLPVQPTITYTNFVKDLIDNNHCLDCHVSGGTASHRDYTTYSGIKVVAISGTLKARAIDGGVPTMPLGFPELPQAIKDTLQMWIDQGALE